MSLDSCYQLLVKSDFRGQDVLNVFFYEHATGAGFAGDLILDFNEVILPAILAIQTNAIQMVSVEAINLGILADFYVLATTGEGAYAEQSLPPSDAIGFTLKTDTRAVRPGSKRICAVPESAVGEGEILDAPYIAKIETLRALLGVNIIGTSDTWKPVVLKRTKTAIAGTVPTKYRYGLPKTEGDYLAAGILSVLTGEFVTSQVSRKRKSG